MALYFTLESSGRAVYWQFPKALPLAGFRRPVNKSLLFVGKITISNKACFAFWSPATIEPDHSVSNERVQVQKKINEM